MGTQKQRVEVEIVVLPDAEYATTPDDVIAALERGECLVEVSLSSEEGCSGEP